MTDEELLREALEALERLQRVVTRDSAIVAMALGNARRCMTKLEQRLLNE